MKFLELLKKNHYARIVSGCVLAGSGALLGTDGHFEIKELAEVFDTIMFIGYGVLTIYCIIGTIAGIYYGLGNGYQPGDYNKWRDGDFEEWKKKNDVGNGWFDRFIDWFGGNSSKHKK